MPLQLLHNTMPTNVGSERDVQAQFEWGLSLSEASLGRAAYEKRVYDLGDYLYYVGAVYPDYFRPLQHAVVTASGAQLANFQCIFATWLYLLHGASDACVEHLARRLSATDLTPMLRFTLEQMLAGICTPAALSALAEYARNTQSVATFEDTGFLIPDGHGPAIPRFMFHRRAARALRLNDEDPADYPHPIGLAVSDVMADAAQDVVTWHYCSLDLADLRDLPAFAAPRIHLVSPPQYDEWTVFCASLSDGRYTWATLRTDGSADPNMERNLREQATTEQQSDKGHLVLLPYDDQLIYCNGHVELTPDVVGDVGGPPIGLYPNPRCPSCSRLMFHISTMTSHVRAYGQGFRSLYLCEDCGLVASHATLWS